jgi:hypothetical protein
MSMAQEVRRSFEGFEFGPPCTHGDLARAERELGHALPAILRDLYLAFDGFLGPTAAPFFYPLLPGGEPEILSLVGLTLFLRGEDYFPEFLQEAVVFGDYGCGSHWGIRLNSPDELFEWYPSDGHHYSVVEGNPMTVWVERRAWYESPDLDP